MNAADNAELPDDLWEVWHWWLRLRETRSLTQTGTGPLLETEVRAFFLNRNLKPHLWEVETLLSLDRLSRTKIEDTDEQ